MRKNVSNKIELTNRNSIHAIIKKNRGNSMKYLIVAIFTILGSCGTSQSDDRCGEGTEVTVTDTTYCVFKSDITETGFRCPADFPVLNGLEGGTLCSADGISDEDRARVQEEVEKKWGKVPVNCAGLDEATCLVNDACESLVGAPLEEEAICFGDDIFLECVDDAGGGDGSFSFGRNPDNNTCWIFRNNDRPAGWESCGDEEDGHLGRECPGGPVSVGQTPSLLECEDIIKTVDYCAAEVLDWVYDSTSKVLTLTDRRVVLNCCGKREMGAYLVDGAYELIIVDRPEDGLRCDCSCVFDFGIEIPNIEPGMFRFEIYQNITDSPDRDFNQNLADSINVPSINGSGSVELIVNDVSIACLPE